MSTILTLRQRLEEWEKSWSSYCQQLVDKSKEQVNSIDPICYFSHSLSLSQYKNELNGLISSFYIHNCLKEPIEHLSLCLKIDASMPYQFSGKYQAANDDKKNGQAWIQVNPDQAKENELWFTYQAPDSLKISEKIIFPEFSITWRNEPDYKLSLTGFLYTENAPDGLVVNNPFQLNMSS